jgi:hypothetical protein
MESLKAEVHKLSSMKNLIAKNEMYKNNEEFREAKKKQSLDYYYRVVKPKRIKASEKPQEEVQENPLERAFC